jgi:hypothetical protein
MIGDSKGFAFLHEGTIFYSPNCSRRVIVPTPLNTSIYHFTRKNAELAHFQQPQWWTEPYGFLAFVPLIPNFDGAAFGCLREIVSHIRSSIENPGKFVLSSEKIAEWTDLEDLMFLVSSLLNNNKKFLLGASLNPIPPSYLRYRFPFDTPRAARLRATTARDWFVILMGRLSFLLGHFEHDNGLKIDVPRWFSYLESQGIPQSWLCSLQASTVCDFSSRCPRVGIFLDFLNDRNRQPQVKWYTFLNIPVWYPWTASHEKAVKGKPQLEYLQPPAELLQVAATIVIRTPTAILPSALLPSSSAPPSFPPHPQSYERHSPQPLFDDQQLYQEMHDNTSGTDFKAIQDAYIATKPWQIFFQARELLNQKKLANETSAQRQARLNRERKPPTTNVVVFSWNWSDEDPHQLVRTRVTRREGGDILSAYSDSQLVYDSYSNVWDACEYFGQSDDDPDDMSIGSPSSASTLSRVPVPSAVVADDEGTSERLEHEAFFRDRIYRLHALPPSERVKKLFLSYSLDTHSKLDLTQDTFDILGYLAFHYGLVTPLPLQSDLPVDLKVWEENIKNVGLDVGKNPPSVDYAATIVNFLKGFQSTAGPTEELWDLRPGNRRRIDRQCLVQIITKQNDNLFFLGPSSLRDEPHSSWTIALTTARDALFVYRLLMEKDFSAISLAYILIDEGIRFLTLQPMLPVSIPSSIRTVRTIIPIRVKDYSFNESDYHSYVRERARLLSSPRGRAALLQGGIIGRIAKEHLGHDSAALGPSSAITVHRQGFSFTDSAGTTYWDDKLMDDEIRNISGSYRCYTGKKDSLYFYSSFIDTVKGNGSQMADVSWWPIPTHWDNHNANGFNWGHWTEWDEIWYQQRVKDILSGDKAGVPFTQSTWRSKLKGAKAWRHVTKRVQDESKAFF